MALLILSIMAGSLAGLLLPTGVEPGVKYEAPTEESFEKLCKRWNIK